jgi:hypothetical protein
MTTIHDDADATRRDGLAATAIPGVAVQSFTATPSSVITGGTTTLAWRVVVGDANDNIDLKLNGELIGTIGHREFTNLTESTDFLLSAATANEEVVLRRLRVRVDAPDCIWAPPIDPFVITQKLKFAFDDRFSGNSQFTLRGGKTAITLSDSTIDIAVPLTIHVDSWFDADMDIAIKLSATGGAGSPVLVLSRGVSLEVSWSFLEHIPSLGCTHFVEEGMSQLGQALMADIVQSELVPEVATGFNDEIAKFCADASQNDPLHRTYVLTVFQLTADGARFKVCPQ